MDSLCGCLNEHSYRSEFPGRYRNMTVFSMRACSHTHSRVLFFFFLGAFLGATKRWFAIWLDSKWLRFWFNKTNKITSFLLQLKCKCTQTISSHIFFVKVCFSGVVLGDEPLGQSSMKPVKPLRGTPPMPSTVPTCFSFRLLLCFTTPKLSLFGLFISWLFLVVIKFLFCCYKIQLGFMHD